MIRKNRFPCLRARLGVAFRIIDESITKLEGGYIWEHVEERLSDLMLMSFLPY